jgi:acetyltransferase
MADYPLHLVRQRRLADRRSVLIRPIRADDEDAERAFFARLSDEAKQLRFLRQAGVLDAQLIHFFSHVDYDRHMAFVCEADDGARIVGEARYLANPDARSCEFGVVVADEWHHAGIAGLLMDALIRFARAQGLETMEGLVLSENQEMLRFVRTLGFEAHPEPPEPGNVRVVLKL